MKLLALLILAAQTVSFTDCCCGVDCQRPNEPCEEGVPCVHRSPSDEVLAQTPSPDITPAAILLDAPPEVALHGESPCLLILEPIIRARGRPLYLIHSTLLI